MALDSELSIPVTWKVEWKQKTVRIPFWSSLVLIHCCFNHFWFSSQTQNLTIFSNTIPWEAEKSLEEFWFPKISPYSFCTDSAILSLFYLKLCSYKANNRQWELICSLGRTVLSKKTLTSISAVGSQSTKDELCFEIVAMTISCRDSCARASSLTCFLRTPGLSAPRVWYSWLYF